MYLDSAGVDEGDKVLEVCVANVAEEDDGVLVTRGVLQQILHMQTYYYLVYTMYKTILKKNLQRQIGKG